MKVLLINCVSDRPEVQLYLGLVRAGVELKLILDPRDSAADMLRQEGIPVVQQTIRNRFDFKFDHTVRAVIAEYQPDIIHAPTSRGVASALRASRGTEIKLVTYRGTLGNLSHWGIPARLSHLHPRVAAIFCNCRAVQSYLHSLGLPLNRLPVVYKGHDPAWYQAANVVSRTELGVADDAFVVGCFANIRPLKGVDILVRAVKQVRESIPSIQCLLVGDSRHRALEKYVAEHDLHSHIRFLGFRDDVPALLPACDVTVMPSVRREGFPRAIVESFSASVPVICSRIGGMPEIVDDGVTGLIVPPGDVAALAEALRTVATDKARFRQAGIDGLQTVTARLSSQQYVNTTVSVYRELIER